MSINEAQGAISEVELDKSLARGIAWTGAVKWVGQIFHWACMIIVARLLTPADYGLVAMATLFLGLVALINELGLGTAIVKHRELTADQIAQINAVAVALGVAGFVVSAIAAVPISLFFGSPELRWVVLMMSSSFLVSGFSTVPSSLLERDLDFRTLALVEGAQVFAQSFTVVVLALVGLTYWALVIGALFGSTVSTSLTMMARFHPFAWPRRRSLAETLTFSWHLLVARVSWYIQSNSDFLVAGWILGKAALGSYTMGWTVATAPIEKVAAIVNRVSFPILSARQNHPALLRRQLLTLTEGLAALTFAASIGLALIAEEFVLGVLGEKWIEAIGPLRLLALLTVFRTVSPLVNQLLIMTGESQFAMRLGLLGIVVPPLFYIGSYWGIIGIAAAWFFAYPVTTIPSYRRVFMKIGLTKREYCKALWPGLSSSLLMAICVLLTKQAIPEAWNPLARLAVEVLIGAAVYTAVLFLLHRERISVFYQLITAMRESDFRPKAAANVETASIR